MELALGGGAHCIFNMRSTLILAGSLACLALTGCESVSEATNSVREKVAQRNAPRTQTYAAPQRAVYDAVKVAAEKMGYRMLRGGPAQGEFDAVSGIGSGDTIMSSRQISMKVKLLPSADGGTIVEVRLTEVIESDSSSRSGMATETPLRDTPQYAVFFRSVQQALDTKADSAKG